MKLAFDLAKNAANLVKHGVSLAQAEHLEWDALVGIPDSRSDYGELRIIGYASLVNGCIVWCLQTVPGCAGLSACARLTSEK